MDDPLESDKNACPKDEICNSEERESLEEAIINRLDIAKVPQLA